MSRLYTPPTFASAPRDVVWHRPNADFSNLRCYERWYYGYNLSACRSPDIAIFTDGACIGNGTHDARAGIGVFFGPDSRYNISEPLAYAPQTNQRAEIHGAILALKKAMTLMDNGWLQTQNVLLISDSDYVVKSMTNWIYKWKANGWRNARGNEVANRGDIEWLDELIEDLGEYHDVEVKFWHVPRAQNEGADELAKNAVRCF